MSDDPGGRQRDVVLALLGAACLVPVSYEESHGRKESIASAHEDCVPERPPASDAEIGRFSSKLMVECAFATTVPASLAASPILSDPVAPLCGLVEQCSFSSAPVAVAAGVSPSAAASATESLTQRRRPQLQLPQPQGANATPERTMWLEDSPRVQSGSEDDYAAPAALYGRSAPAPSPLFAIQKIWAKPLTPQPAGHHRRANSTSAAAAAAAAAPASELAAKPLPLSGRWRDLMDSESSGAGNTATSRAAGDAAALDSLGGAAKSLLQASSTTTATVLAASPLPTRVARKPSVALDLAQMAFAPMHGASPISLLARSDGTLSPCESGLWSGGEESDDESAESDAGGAATADGCCASALGGQEAAPATVPSTPTGTGLMSSGNQQVDRVVVGSVESPRVPRRQRSHAGFDSECPYGSDCKQWRLNKCRYWPWHESEGHPLPPPKTPKGTDPAGKKKKKLRKRPNLTPTQRHAAAAPAWGGRDITPRGLARGGSLTPRYDTPQRAHFVEGVWAVAPMMQAPPPPPHPMNPHAHGHWVHAVPVPMHSPQMVAVSLAAQQQPPPPGWHGGPPQLGQQQQGGGGRSGAASQQQQYVMSSPYVAVPPPTFVPHHHW